MPVEKPVRQRDIYIDNPAVINVINKLVKDRRHPYVPSENRLLVETRVDETARNINDSQSLRQLLPDIELAKHILVSAILSPHTMTTTDVSYGVSPAFEKHPLASQMISIIQDHFKSDYKIEDQLSTILGKALFDDGAYIKIVIPETEVDRMITGRAQLQLENFKEIYTSNFDVRNGIGILGNLSTDTNRRRRSHDRPNMESFFNKQMVKETLVPTPQEKKLGIKVSDNPVALLTPYVIKVLEDRKIDEVYHSPHLNLEKEAPVYKRVPKDQRVNIKEIQPKEQSFDQALTLAIQDPMAVNVHEHDIATVMDPPPESVIPVYSTNGTLGYWVVLDEMGSPIRKTRIRNYYTELGNTLKSNKQLSALIDNTMRNTYGDTAGDSPMDLERKAIIYGKLVEKELVERLQKGIYANRDIDLGRRNEVNLIMLARAASNKFTQLIYIPSDYVAYMAFDVDDDGVGRSLIENTKIVGSLRALVTLGATMTHLRNAIPRTLLNIEFTGDEVDPEKIRDHIVQSYIESRSPFFPIAEPNPVNLVNYVRRGGVEVATSGHPSLPDTKVTVESTNSNINPPDTDLIDNLKRQQHLGFGMTPELIDEAQNLELATPIIARDLLLSKRVLMYQRIFCPMISKHLQTYIRYSGRLIKQLKDLLEKEKSRAFKGEFKGHNPDSLISLFISSFKIELPKPDSTTLDSQVAAATKYGEALEVFLNSYISTEMFTGENVRDLDMNVELLRQQMYAALMRRYIRKNNIMPELEEILRIGAKRTKHDAGTLLSEVTDHEELIKGGLLEYLVALAERNKTIEDEIANANIEPSDNYGNEGNEEEGEGEEDAAEEGGEEEGGEEDLPPEMEEEAPEETPEETPEGKEPPEEEEKPKEKEEDKDTDKDDTVEE